MFEKLSDIEESLKALTEQFKDDELKPGIYFYRNDNGGITARTERFTGGVDTREAVTAIPLSKWPEEMNGIVSDKFGVHTSWLGKDFYVALHDPLTRQVLSKVKFDNLEACLRFMKVVTS